MVGSEGMVGLPALLGAEVSAQQCMAQADTQSLRVGVARGREAYEESREVRRVFNLFTQALLNVGGQTSACNRLHSIEQRLARWLLMASDRLQSDVLPLTHEFLSSMLGVRRAGVTSVAGELQRTGLIRYRSGRIEIIDREGLEATACECYGIAQEHLSHLP
jgi:CRP-like cAMP-binding protein